MFFKKFWASSFFLNFPVFFPGLQADPVRRRRIGVRPSVRPPPVRGAERRRRGRGAEEEQGGVRVHRGQGEEIQI